MEKAKVLVAIFHKPGANDGNFESLKTTFKDFDIYVPEVPFYGNKWRETKRVFFLSNYDSLFVICSDVRIICGDITGIIDSFAKDLQIGCYGFGTLENCTFSWLKYTNIPSKKAVPFIEGYCIGVNKTVIDQLTLENVYGYGIDVEIGYKTYVKGLKCTLSNEACIIHAAGKSYSDTEATIEYQAFLIEHPNITKFLTDLNVYFPKLR